MDIPAPAHSIPAPSCSNVTQDNCGHPRILPHSIPGPSCPNIHPGQLWTSQDSPPAFPLNYPTYTQDTCEHPRIFYLPIQSLVLVVPTYTQDNCGHPRILPLPSHSIPVPSCQLTLKTTVNIPTFSPCQFNPCSNVTQNNPIS